MNIDATPGAHSFLDALVTVSFKLACGCNRRMTSVKGALRDKDRAVDLKTTGSTYDCPNHGDQVITRTTTRLVGWDDKRRS